MPRHTGRRLSGKARKRAWELHSAKIYNAVLRNEVQSLKKENMSLKMEVRELNRQLELPKDGAIVVRKHKNKLDQRGETVTLAVSMDLEYLRREMFYHCQQEFASSERISHRMAFEIKEAIKKLIDEEILNIRRNPIG